MKMIKIASDLVACTIVLFATNFLSLRITLNFHFYSYQQKCCFKASLHQFINFREIFRHALSKLWYHSYGGQYAKYSEKCLADYFFLFIIFIPIAELYLLIMLGKDLGFSLL